MGMIKLIRESAMTLIDVWNNMIEAKGGAADIKIDQHMRSFSGDVISKACFGSDYSKGGEIFVKLRALLECASKKGFSFGIPFMKCLPTKSNREAWAPEKDLRTLILKVVKERNEVVTRRTCCKRFSGRSSEQCPDATDSFIVDNCKNIYLAGFETTALAATCCLMLLAANPEWQERVRGEVLGVCDGQAPDNDTIRKMKLLSVAINESLRLYPPVAIMSIEVFEEMKFGGVHVPKGVNIWALVLTLHTDPEVWGADSYQFNPDRFANGACKLPHLYMPFGVGPRVCLGQHLASAELKILLSLILSNFSFTLSPTYIHSPTLNLVIEPEHGVDLNVKKV
ncbi:cytochrome P450 714C2-like [Coffea arabica]|uniref:Cytochrome P450 714C2-like n=1 Tax=Coffea arabica TaxID=13443 RepID=A0ABM4UD47_COFAR